MGPHNFNPPYIDLLICVSEECCGEAEAYK